jgi:hypothetical protein
VRDIKLRVIKRRRGGKVLEWLVPVSSAVTNESGELEIEVDGDLIDKLRPPVDSGLLQDLADKSKYTVDEAALLLNISSRMVYYRIRSGQLLAETEAGYRKKTLYVTRDAVVEYWASYDIEACPLVLRQYVQKMQEWLNTPATPAQREKPCK